MKPLKYDQGKPMWHLLPLNIISEVVRVLTFGAGKYTAGGWQQGDIEDARNRYFSAALRHMTEWQSGETRDKESGLHHLAHAICCLIFIMWYENENTLSGR